MQEEERWDDAAALYLKMLGQPGPHDQDARTHAILATVLFPGTALTDNSRVCRRVLTARWRSSVPTAKRMHLPRSAIPTKTRSPWGSLRPLFETISCASQVEDFRLHWGSLSPPEFEIPQKSKDANEQKAAMLLQALGVSTSTPQSPTSGLFLTD